jgi:hypothetical protein
MSLLSRVSSVEQFNPGAFSPERGLSPAPEARVRKLSFNPVPGEWEPFGAADKSGGSPSRRGSVRDGSRRGSVRERQRRDSVLSVGGFEIPRLGREAEPIGAFEVRKSKRVCKFALDMLSRELGMGGETVGAAGRRLSCRYADCFPQCKLPPLFPTAFLPRA